MGGRLLTVLALATALLCLSAGPAAAGGTITPLPDDAQPGLRQVAGPAFAGDAVAYAAPNDRNGFVVNVQNPDGSVASQHVQALAGGPLGDYDYDAEALAASPQRVVFAEALTTCHDETGCKYDDFEALEAGVFAGVPGEPLGFRGCSSDEYPRADASGTAIAYYDDCAGGVVVRDPLAPPQTAWRVFPAGAYGDVRLAGSYLAVGSFAGPYVGGAANIRVYDWHSGEVAFEVADNVGRPSFDIQDDGTLVYTTQVASGDSSDVWWASAADPAPHLIGHHTPPAPPLRVADGRVALRGRKGFEVLALDGTKLASTPAGGGAVGGFEFDGFDFDGRRLTHVDQPCEAAALVTWDLAGSAPALPADKCPAARAASASGLADLRHRRVDLPLRCPADPPLGCGGYWAVRFNTKKASRSRFRVVALNPGKRRTVRFRLPYTTACRLAAARSKRATIDLSASSVRRSAHEHGSASFRLRSLGRARGC
jgi:hypothetical protein